MTILAGDVGGTKTNLALFHREGKVLHRARLHSFPSGSYPDLESILAEFLPGKPGIAVACIGVAGPVVSGRSRVTNLPWVVDTESIQTAIGAKRTFIINDLQATAFAVPFLPDGSLAVIQRGEADLRGEVRLFRYLQGRYGRVSVERAVSGPGLHDIYRFLRESEKMPESGEVEARMAVEEAPRVISEEGLSGTSVTCREALRIFSSLYGAQAGNLALQVVATGGVVLGGGIASKVLPVLSEGPFLESFLGKGRFREFLSRVPVKVIRDDKAALVGAAHYALAMGEAGG
jgi:glucokinase